MELDVDQVFYCFERLILFFLILISLSYLTKCKKIKTNYNQMDDDTFVFWGIKKSEINNNNNNIIKPTNQK